MCYSGYETQADRIYRAWNEANDKIDILKETLSIDEINQKYSQSYRLDEKGNLVGIQYYGLWKTFNDCLD